MRDLFLATLLLPSFVWAAPSPSSTSGSPEHGEPLVIYGSGFGYKETASPLKWDDFQDGSVGERLVRRSDGGTFDVHPQPTWRPRYAADTAYDQRLDAWIYGRQRYTGDVTAMQDFYPVDGGSNRIIAAGNVTGTSPEDGYPSPVWYVSFWAYQDDYDGTALECINAKVYGNLTGIGYPSTNLTNPRWDEYWNNSSGHIAMTLCDGTQGPNIWGVYQDVRGQWNRVERYLDIGDEGAANGYHAGHVNLQVVGSASGVMLSPEGCDETKWPYKFYVGNYFNAQNDARMHQYISEMYVDHTFARVEIGNASTWSACTHREIQIPTAWSGTEITVTLNIAGFPDGQDMYLYVVDEDRAVNSAGLLLGEGGWSAPTPGGIANGAISSLTYEAQGGAEYYLVWVIEQGGSVPRNVGQFAGLLATNIRTGTDTGTVYVTAHDAQDGLLATSQAAAYGGDPD